jgi:hypothetical protein
MKAAKSVNRDQLADATDMVHARVDEREARHQTYTSPRLVTIAGREMLLDVLGPAQAGYGETQFP